MLILTRKKEESIIIDEKIEIKIIEIDGNKVKIGINAPKNVQILRKEIYKKISEENQKASEVNINMKELEKLFSKK